MLPRCADGCWAATGLSEPPPPPCRACRAPQNLKDAIMVTTAGAETLPFLASCVVLPASPGFYMAYNTIVESLPSVSRRRGGRGVAPLGNRNSVLHRSARCPSCSCQMHLFQ